MPRSAADDATAAEVAAPRRGARDWLGVVVRGMAMGIAELVPGVSGGTIAFVTGIYEELIGTLAGLRPAAIGVLHREGVRRFWVAHNLSFLLALGVGMLASIVLFARLLGYLLDTMPTVVWAFFFGLITASVVHIGRYRRPVLLAGYGLIGALLAYAVLKLGYREGETPLAMFFVGGMVAVSAWLLPAVSGSFLLLVLGLYEPVLRAFNAGDWPIPFTLGLGCVVGLLVFARFLHWLMSRFREPMLALLTGFMAMSLMKLWPWQQADVLLSPLAFEAVTGQPALIVPALAAVALGVLALWLLARLE